MLGLDVAVCGLSFSIRKYNSFIGSITTSNFERKLAQTQAAEQLFLIIVDTMAASTQDVPELNLEAVIGFSGE